MSNNPPVDVCPRDLLPALPGNVPALGSLEGKIHLFASWQANKALLPGVISARNPNPWQFNSAARELAERKNAVFALVLVNNLAIHLDRQDFRAAVISTAKSLNLGCQTVPPGLTLEGTLASNADWIHDLLSPQAKGLDRFNRALQKAAALTTSSGTAQASGAHHTAADPSAELSLHPPAPGDMPDFLRWWNRATAIDALLTITAGARTWPEFRRALLQAGGPLDAKWCGSAPFIPTGKNVTIHLHAHPELCELLALGKSTNQRNNSLWSIKLDTKNLSGNSSQSVYRYATGIKVGHLYMATLMEHLRPPLRADRHQHRGAQEQAMTTPSRTLAGDAARQEAVRLLRHTTLPAGEQDQASPRPARRFAPPQVSTAVPSVGDDQRPIVNRLSSTALRYRPPAGTAAWAATGAATSLGSIVLDPDLLSPDYGLSMVKLHAVLVHQGLQHLPLELVDDADDPMRVHLVVPDPNALPGLNVAATERLLQHLEAAMTNAPWVVALEPDYPRVVNVAVGLRIAR